MKKDLKNKKIPDLKTYKFDTSTYVCAFSFSKRDVATGRLIITRNYPNHLGSKKSFIDAIVRMSCLYFCVLYISLIPNKAHNRDDLELHRTLYPYLLKHEAKAHHGLQRKGTLWTALKRWSQKCTKIHFCLDKNALKYIFVLIKMHFSAILSACNFSNVTKKLIFSKI